MSAFKPMVSVIGSDYSTNWAHCSFSRAQRTLWIPQLMGPSVQLDNHLQKLMLRVQMTIQIKIDFKKLFLTFYQCHTVRAQCCKNFETNVVLLCGRVVVSSNRGFGVESSHCNFCWTFSYFWKEKRTIADIMVLVLQKHEFQSLKLW